MTWRLQKLFQLDHFGEQSHEKIETDYKVCFFGWHIFSFNDVSKIVSRVRWDMEIQRSVYLPCPEFFYYCVFYGKFKIIKAIKSY